MSRHVVARLCGTGAVAALVVVVAGLWSAQREPASADGRVMPPRTYRGSLEELSQEAVIIFHDSEQPGAAVEDLILKISVQSSGEVRNFGWVVPFPQEPKAEREDARIFNELWDYVEARTRRNNWKARGGLGEAGAPPALDNRPVDVLSRKIVGRWL